MKAHISRYQHLLNFNQQTSPLIQVGFLKIDPTGHHVYSGEDKVNMTSKEFSLLLFLASHPNRVWSKEALFEAVWGFEVLDSEVSTVVVHIKRIREKLRTVGIVDSPIETLWGSGYRFNL